MYKFFLLVTCTTVVPGWAGFNREQSINQHENKALGVCSSLFPDQYYKDCFELGGKCYCQFEAAPYEDAGTWEGKQRLCSQENMTILAIETPEEDKLIYDYFQKHHDLKYSEDYYLTAGKYSETYQRWEWISEWRDGNSYENETTTLPPPAPGQPITYTNWYPGQPSNVEDGNRCLGLMFFYGIPYEGGYWDDIDCDYISIHGNYQFNLFICESVD
ncbi:brevican core protein-like isoform X2 [Daphnia pulicaria]|uniref:brevican core protein-like isoform X2 n=1 Tax=Daphnia pulicaria TaxID=35523 RepID=UPI001EE9CB53|nr:brevican core protein-like isoform X2 [Daphnia pulicaria]